MHHVWRVELNRSRWLVGIAIASLLALVASACTSTSTSATAPTAGKCQVSASAAPLQFGASGGNGTLSISASRDCGWTVAPQAAWVTVSGTPSGYGDAALSYTVASNPVPAQRAAELVVESQHLQLTQAAAACTYTLSRSNDTVAATGGTLSFQVATLTGCTWTASVDAAWLSLPEAKSGTATATIDVVAAANTGAARVGTVTVAGHAYTVSQEAAASSPAPSPEPSPSPSPSPSPGPAPTPVPISFSGTVSSLGGSCPSLSFQAGGHPVSTDNMTTYSRGKCGDLSNGDTVKVDGTLQIDGSVLADRIEITRNDK